MRMVSGDTAEPSWQAHDGGVLALRVASPNLLLSAGHDRKVKAWRIEHGERVRSSSFSLVGEHQGSIFALDVKHGRVITGSFDRSAAIWTLPPGILDSDATMPRQEAELPTAVVLGEHTGWVRDALLSKSHALSIGCNLVNVWTPGESSDGTWPRLCLLDAGPSPGEEPWRRHDILRIALDPTEQWLFASLNDGSLRAWPASRVFAAEDTEDNALDQTSTARVEKGVEQGVAPTAATRAHRGRVTALLSHSLALAAHTEPRTVVLSAGHDGDVQVHELMTEDGESRLQLVDKVHVGGASKILCLAQASTSTGTGSTGDTIQFFCGNSDGGVFSINARFEVPDSQSSPLQMASISSTELTSCSELDGGGRSGSGVSAIAVAGDPAGRPVLLCGQQDGKIRRTPVT